MVSYSYSNGIFYNCFRPDYYQSVIREWRGLVRSIGMLFITVLTVNISIMGVKIRRLKNVKLFGRSTISFSF